MDDARKDKYVIGGGIRNHLIILHNKLIEIKKSRSFEEIDEYIEEVEEDFDTDEDQWVNEIEDCLSNTLECIAEAEASIKSAIEMRKVNISAETQKTCEFIHDAIRSFFKMQSDSFIYELEHNWKIDEDPFRIGSILINMVEERSITISNQQKMKKKKRKLSKGSIPESIDLQ